jgi:hypothetical protein
MGLFGHLTRRQTKSSLDGKRILSFKFFMGLHPQICLSIQLSPDALMDTAFTSLMSKAQLVGTHVERIDTRPQNQVSQMGRSGPRNSSSKTVIATPPHQLAEELLGNDNLPAT